MASGSPARPRPASSRVSDPTSAAPFRRPAVQEGSTPARSARWQADSISSPRMESASPASAMTFRPRRSSPWMPLVPSWMELSFWSRSQASTGTSLEYPYPP